MLSDKTLRLRPNASRVSVSFLFWILQDQTIRRQIANLATGTSGSMKNISQGGVRSLAFARPDLEEQGRLTSRLSAAAAREAALAVSAEKLKGLRLALMHDLLTGAVPVPIPEAEDG